MAAYQHLERMRITRDVQSQQLAVVDVVASAPDAGLQADLQPDEPVTTRYLLVYLTKLPPAPGGFEGQIAEVSVSG